MNELLGNQIRILRTAHNFTQEQMAVQLGISRQKYARIENGMNSITLEILVKIAEILDVYVSDITRVLDEEPEIEFRSDAGNIASADKILDMLDLFYANKHVFLRLQTSFEEQVEL